MPYKRHPSLPLNSTALSSVDKSSPRSSHYPHKFWPSISTFSPNPKWDLDSKGSKSGERGKTQSDLIAQHKLETEFFLDYVRHINWLREAKNKYETVEEEEWRNCGELGRGGFGVVNRQMEKTTGRFRAVKTIHKRLPLKLDYSRELLAMAILAKVCGLAPKEFTPLYHFQLIFLLSNCYSSIRHYLWSS